MIVYKFTSPSGKFYFGKSSKTLEERLDQHKIDRQQYINHNRPLSRFYSAWKKYPIEQWTREIVQQVNTVDEVNLLEQQLIEKFNTRDSKYGYNMAPGGNGGNTGRNGDAIKRTQHSKFLKERLTNPEVMAFHVKTLKQAHTDLQNNPEKLLAKRKKMSNSMPKGKAHHKHSGLWVVNHNTYESSSIAALKESVSIDIIQQWCNAPDKIIKRYKKKISAGIEGTTRRDSGFYRIKESLNGKI